MILEAAARLFSERGYANVSIRDVCREANTTPPMIYYYFKDKKRLFDAAVNQKTSMREFIARLRDQSRLDDPESSARAFVDTYLSGFPTDAFAPGLYLSETWVDYTQAPAATFTIPVANGNYSVYLHFVDWSSQTSKPGDRLFDVDLDGTREITDLDIIAAVGKDTALVESFDVSVTTGSIVLTLTADVFYPEIAAMEILPQGTPHFPTTTTPACGTGAVSAKCKCSASVVSTGYCCDGTVETSACSASSCPDSARIRKKPFRSPPCGFRKTVSNDLIDFFCCRPPR